VHAWTILGAAHRESVIIRIIFFDCIFQDNKSYSISVPDLDQATLWYKQVFGFTVIRRRVEFVADDSLTRRAVRDIHGPALKKMRMAWLTSGNQAGFEVF
jgi:hypothetical protein